MAYAEVSDIESRMGRTLTADEQAQASALADGASAMLDALVPDTTGKADVLKLVCVSMVVRALNVSADAFGAESMSMTAGVYSQSWNYSNPSGDMYLTSLEKRMLGITRGYIGSIAARTGVDDD